MAKDKPSSSEPKAEPAIQELNAEQSVRPFSPSPEVTYVLRRDMEILADEAPFPEGSVIAKLTIDKSINANWLAHALMHHLIIPQ